MAKIRRRQKVLSAPPEQAIPIPSFSRLLERYSRHQNANVCVGVALIAFLPVRPNYLVDQKPVSSKSLATNGIFGEPLFKAFRNLHQAIRLQIIL